MRRGGRERSDGRPRDAPVAANGVPELHRWTAVVARAPPWAGGQRSPGGIIRRALAILLLASGLRLLDVPNEWVLAAAAMALVGGSMLWIVIRRYTRELARAGGIRRTETETGAVASPSPSPGLVLAPEPVPIDVEEPR